MKLSDVQGCEPCLQLVREGQAGKLNDLTMAIAIVAHGEGWSVRKGLATYVLGYHLAGHTRNLDEIIKTLQEQM